MHRDDCQSKNRTILELEAESVACVFNKHFRLDGLSSPNYNALHGATAAIILEHIEDIRHSALQIINAIENNSKWAFLNSR